MIFQMFGVVVLRRLYPAFVSLLGGVGLGLAAFYFVGIYFTFQPGMEEWAEFFDGHLLALLIPPYLFLVLHMVLRNHVGYFFLKRGEFEAAISYAKRRSKDSWIRGRREVGRQRMVWARALIAQGKYDAASELLRERLTEAVGVERVEISRWLIEISLRVDEPGRVEEWLGEFRDAPGKNSKRRFSAFKAAEAELAIRVGDLKRYEDCAMAAIWADGTHPRATFSRALAMMEFEEGDEVEEELLKMLAMVEKPLGEELPARGTEIKAMRAGILYRRGEVEEAGRLWKEASMGASDMWTERILDRVRGIMDGIES